MQVDKYHKTRYIVIGIAWTTMQRQAKHGDMFKTDQSTN